MHKNRFQIYLFSLLFMILAPSIGAQNFIETGNFANNCGWDYFGRGGCTSAYFTASAGNSYIWTSQTLAAGPNYFRLFTDWGGAQQRHEPNATTQLNFETPYTLNSNWGLANANFINSASTAYNYVFKSPNGDGINNAPQIIIFEVQGAIQTIANVSQLPAAVAPGQTVAVTATMSGPGTLSPGQGVYLRYSNDNFATSTVTEMVYSGTGTNYAASIPGTINVMGANISYYVFTSGDGMTIAPANADWFTINLNNNSGSNFSYTVANIWTTNPAGSGLWSDPTSWDPGTIPPTGVPVYIEDNMILDMDAEIAAIAIDPGVTFTADDGGDRTLSIQTGGGIVNNGTFAAPGGRIWFLGTGTLSGAVPFHSVQISGGVNFGTTSSVADTLKLLAGGFVDVSPPTLLAGSHLNYATQNTQVAPFSRGLEWNAPYNVSLSENTWVDWPAGANLVSQTILGDLHIEEGGLLWANVEQPLLVMGHVNVDASGTIEMSTLVGGDLYIGRNLTMNGTLNCNNRMFRFDGNANQSISGNLSGTNKVDYLDVFNPQGINLLTHIEIEDTLRFYQGNIYLNNYNLTFLPPAYTSAVPSYTPRAASMCITSGTGEVRKIYGGAGSFTFPVGDTTTTTEYSPCTIDFTSGTFAVGAYLGVRVTDAKHPLNASLINFLTRYWDVSQSGISTFQYECSFSYTNADITGTETSISGWKSSNGGVSWDPIQAVSAATNLVEGSGLTTFSVFTGGDNASFPVEWGYFEAVREGESARLDWGTLSELNCDFFEIQKSLDGSNFEVIGKVQGAGTTTQPSQYVIFDHNPQEGVNYYRLRQVDFDGRFTYSDVRSVRFEGLPGQNLFSMTPFQIVAGSGDIWVDMNSVDAMDVELQVFDLGGRKLASRKIALNPGNQQELIGNISLEPGNVIIVRAIFGQNQLSSKIRLR